MRRCGWWIGAIILVIGSVAPAQSAKDAVTNPPVISAFNSVSDPLLSIPPLDLSALNEISGNQQLQSGDVPRLMAAPVAPPSIYAPEEPERPEDGTNKGGVNIDLDFRYLTDYVYRGVSHNGAVVNAATHGRYMLQRQSTNLIDSDANLHASNFQTDAKIAFNLGKLPHPFVGVFSNVNDSDPVSRFQEIRPFFGFDYTIRPLIFEVGHNTYIYPERESYNPSPNTSEVYLRVTLDDSYFFLTHSPILSPYVYGAYDYQKSKGWYLEAGVKHDFEFEDFGFTLSPHADVAYISHFPQQFIALPQFYADSGFQHYDVGVVGTLSLNHMFQLSPRYGQFAIEGYLTYTGRFGNRTQADSELWGGVGLKYRY